MIARSLTRSACGTGDIGSNTTDSSVASSTNPAATAHVGSFATRSYSGDTRGSPPSSSSLDWLASISTNMYVTRIAPA